MQHIYMHFHLFHDLVFKWMWNMFAVTKEITNFIGVCNCIHTLHTYKLGFATDEGAVLYMPCSIGVALKY